MKTQSLNLAENQPQKVKNSFWRRQFQIETTKKQKIFDWSLGVIVPVVCVVFDPVVFKGDISKGALLGSAKPFAYILSFVSIMTLAAFLLWGEKLKWLNGLTAGLFAAGALISFIVGVLLFPFSLIGIFIVIGILGFTPLFAAFIYLRNSIRAYKFAKPILGAKTLKYSLIISAIFSLTIPYVLNMKIYGDLQAMKNGDVQTIKENAQKLKYLAPIVNFDSLAGNYCDSENQEEEKSLAEAYQNLTGKSMQPIDNAICYDF